jgi:hypothetical protein
MSNYVNSYRVIIRMENDEVIEWEGYADDSDHAEGLALDYAKARTNEQAYEIMEVDEFDQFEVLTEHEASEMYDDMLDDCNEEVQVCGMSYNPSRVLKEVDPIAYNCGFSDFCDSLLDNHQLVEGFY